MIYLNALHFACEEENRDTVSIILDKAKNIDVNQKATVYLII